MTENTTKRRAPRADGQRNRDTILDVATVVLAEQGTSVDVREIARRAGVGMGTLYRHFPKKEDLVRTVLANEFAEWAESARRSAAATEAPWEALADFYLQALTGYARHRAITEHFAVSWAEPDPEGLDRLRLVIDELHTRATAAGVLRPDVTVDDLLLLLVALGHAVQVADEREPQAWQKLLHICLGGLREQTR